MSEPHHFSSDDPSGEVEALPRSLQVQSVLDLAQRTRNGVPLYPSIWLALMQLDHTMSRHPAFALGNAVVILLLTAGRWVWQRDLSASLARSLERTRRALRWASTLQNLYWGVLCVMIYTARDAEHLRWFMLVSTVGISAGGTVIVAIDAVLPRVYAGCLLGPTFVTLALHPNADNLAVCVLILVFFLYASGVRNVVSRDYWARLRAQALLEQRAQDLEHLSRTDPLTQIANRLDFQARLDVAWRDARRRQEALSLAMVDLDHFKRLNDTYGHPFGDRCLQAAARALSQSVRRPGDSVARYGGEEFVILMPNTPLEGARGVATRVLAAIRETVVDDGRHQVALSCSIGVATQLMEAGADPAALLREADEALYAAKQAGRGRVICVGDASAEHAARTPSAEQTPASSEG